MVVNAVIGGVLLVGALIYWKGIGPWLKARREKKEKAERDAAQKAENTRKRLAYSNVLRFLTDQWISADALLAKLAESDGITVEEYFQPKMFEGLEHGISLKYVEKSGLNYRLTKLGVDKKARTDK